MVTRAAAQVSHLSATPVGLLVSATAEVTEGGEKSCTFKVTATDSSSDKLVGEGTHTRVLINTEKFMAKASSKLSF